MSLSLCHRHNAFILLSQFLFHHSIVMILSSFSYDYAINVIQSWLCHQCHAVVVMPSSTLQLHYHTLLISLSSCHCCNTGFMIVIVTPLLSCANRYPIVVIALLTCIFVIPTSQCHPGRPIFIMTVIVTITTTSIFHLRHAIIVTQSTYNCGHNAVVLLLSSSEKYHCIVIMPQSQ